MKKRFVLLMLVAVSASFVLAACGGQVQEAAQSVAEQIEVTRIVEVTRVVEAAAGDAEAAPVVTGDTLGIVQDRGTLKCGGNQSVPGFGYINPDTNDFEGFDIDYCKAIAAAVLNNAEAIEVRPTTANERFPVLQSGEVDILIRNTTWTISRDTSLGFDFVPTTFYDGQGMMVRVDSDITDLAGLEGGTICVQSGTTTEKNLADVFRAQGIEFTPVVFDNADSTREAYDQGQCDGFTTDKSGLVSQPDPAGRSGRPYDPRCDDVQGAARPAGPSWRRQLVRYRQVDGQLHHPG